MKYIWRNARIRLIICAAGVALLFVMMEWIQGKGYIMTFGTMWGGVPLVSISQRGCFLLCCFLGQYLNIDIICFFLKNNAAIYTRYGSRRKPLFVMGKTLLVIQLLFVLLSSLLCFVFFRLMGQIPTEGEWRSLLPVLAKTWFFCLLQAQGQALLILMQRQTQAFLLLTGIVYALAMASCYPVAHVLPLPSVVVPAVKLPYVFSCVAVFTGLCFVTVRIIDKKETG